MWQGWTVARKCNQVENTNKPIWLVNPRIKWQVKSSQDYVLNVVIYLVSLLFSFFLYSVCFCQLKCELPDDWLRVRETLCSGHIINSIHYIKLPLGILMKRRIRICIYMRYRWINTCLTERAFLKVRILWSCMPDIIWQFFRKITWVL